MFEIGIDAYWQFYRHQSEVLIRRGIEFKQIGAKKAYINKLWEKEKKLRKIMEADNNLVKKIIQQSKEAIEEAEKATMIKQEVCHKLKTAIEEAKKALEILSNA